MALGPTLKIEETKMDIFGWMFVKVIQKKCQIQSQHKNHKETTTITSSEALSTKAPSVKTPPTARTLTDHLTTTSAQFGPVWVAPIVQTKPKALDRRSWPMVKAPPARKPTPAMVSKLVGEQLPRQQSGEMPLPPGAPQLCGKLSC